MFWKKVDVFAAVLLVIGGLNWGLMGFFNFNLIAMILNHVPYVSRILYGLVGLSAVYQVFQWRAISKRWGCTLPGRFAKSSA